MTRAVWKFPVLSTGPMAIDIPFPGKILHVDRDPATGLIAFWADVSIGTPTMVRRFQVFGTGHEIPADATYLGTVVMGEFVWHLFELATGAAQ